MQSNNKKGKLHQMGHNATLSGTTVIQTCGTAAHTVHGMQNTKMTTLCIIIIIIIQVVIQLHGLPTFAREGDYIHANKEMLTYAHTPIKT